MAPRYIYLAASALWSRRSGVRGDPECGLDRVEPVFNLQPGM